MTAPSDQETWIHLALTDRPGGEAERLEAVRALGERGDHRACPALRALTEPGATFSSWRLRRAAKQALAQIQQRHAAEPGALALAPEAPEAGALSDPDEGSSRLDEAGRSVRPPAPRAPRGHRSG